MQKKEKKDEPRVYQGDIRITTKEQWEEFNKKYDAITGSIDLSGCTGLTSVTFQKDVKVSGSIDLSGCTGLTSVTFQKGMQSGYIDLDDNISETILSMRFKKARYSINNVEFPRQLFDDVRKGILSAAEVFAIPNMEQRRIAYERMDKAKMAALSNLAVIDEVQDDGYGYPMRVVSFTLNGYEDTFRYLNCNCPSTGREYYLETRQTTCEAAKAASFGINTKFDVEY